MKIQRHVPLRNFTTLRVGGEADFFTRVRKVADAVETLRFAREKKIPIFWFGGGSNTLFSDADFRGLVVRNELGGIKFQKQFVTVGSGVTLAELIQKSVAKKLAGLEKLAGIPGTVGGAIAGNAGAHDAEIGALVTRATLLTRAGEVKNVDQKYFRFRYRTSRLKKSGDVLLDVTLALTPTREDLNQTIRNLLRARIGKQPRGNSAGSFFQNPKNQKAWELIAGAGLRGARIGGAEMSATHANHLITTDSACADDVLKLMRLVQKKVFAKSGVRLRPEVVIVKNFNPKLSSVNKRRK